MRSNRSTTDKPAIRRSFLPLLSALVVVLLTTGVVSGSVFKSGDDVTISNLHVIDDDFYFVGEQAAIDGTIRGDLVVAASRLNIRGQIDNSANILGQYVRHDGTIAGSMRVFAYDLELSGTIGRSADFMVGYVHLRPGSVIERDVHGQGSSFNLEGEIRGNVRLHAETVHLKGQFDGDVRVTAKKIEVSSDAVIRGNLTYISDKEEVLTVAPGGDIRGEVIWRLPEQAEEQPTDYTGIVLQISSMLAAFIFGIIAVRLFRPYAEESFQQLQRRPAASAATGVLGVLGLVFVIVVFLLALGMLLVGLVLLSSEGLSGLGLLLLVFSILAIPITTFVSVAGGIILYSGKILVGFVLGYILLSLLKPGRRMLGSFTLLVGLVILLVLFWLPYVGTVVYVLSTVFGAGAILLGIRFCRKGNHNGTGGAIDDTTPPPEAQ